MGDRDAAFRPAGDLGAVGVVQPVEDLRHGRDRPSEPSVAQRARALDLTIYAAIWLVAWLTGSAGAVAKLGPRGRAREIAR